MTDVYEVSFDISDTTPGWQEKDNLFENVTVRVRAVTREHAISLASMLLTPADYEFQNLEFSLTQAEVQS